MRWVANWETEIGVGLVSTCSEFLANETRNRNPFGLLVEAFDQDGRIRFRGPDFLGSSPPAKPPSIADHRFMEVARLIRLLKVPQQQLFFIPPSRAVG